MKRKYVQRISSILVIMEANQTGMNIVFSAPSETQNNGPHQINKCPHAKRRFKAAKSVKKQQWYWNILMWNVDVKTIYFENI